jgi:alkylation response protein AidB-like acyl-CoA dehydrogenase
VWTVALGMLAHERSALAGSSIHLSGDGYQAAVDDDGPEALVGLARRLGLANDVGARRSVATAHAAATVDRLLAARVRAGVANGTLPPVAGAVARLSAGLTHVLHARLAFEIAGRSAVFCPGDELERVTLDYLVRQGQTLGGGSAEMQRNLISERLLGMPREPTPDRDLPFRDVRPGA